MRVYAYVCSILAISLCLSVGWSQELDYANDWYKNASNRNHVKLLVAEDAIYRISAQELAAAGHDLSTVNPDELRLYYRGQEVRRFIKQDGNRKLEFIEFYGQKNDGRQDSLMYREPTTGLQKSSEEYQPNINLSIFTDTSAYFLIWGDGQGRHQVF